MRYIKPIVSALVLSVSTMVLRADEQLPVLKVGRQVYTNATVFKVTTTDIFFTSKQGAGNAKLKDLSPELQKHFHYDAGKAVKTEQVQAAGNARYHALADNRPGSGSVSWGVDFRAALARARSEKKMVLLDFTGSDWCGWCIRFDQEVLSTAKFSDYAGSRLVLVEVDFPRNKPQNDALRRDNQALQQKYHVDGYPTFVLLNANGDEVGRQVGYLAGGPDKFVAELNGFAKK